jgi:ribosomal-protein-alanine N-acetyltransferase
MIKQISSLQFSMVELFQEVKPIFTVPEIETARLRLRRFTPNDFDALFQIFSNPQVTKYFGEGDTPSKEETFSLLNKYIDLYWQEYHLGKWAVVHRESGKLIGFCGYTMLRKIPEMAYLIDQDYWGVGLATEAAYASLRYAFEIMKVELVTAYTRPENKASQRVLEKIGMTYETVEALYGYVFDKFSIKKTDFQLNDSPFNIRRDPKNR